MKLYKLLEQKENGDGKMYKVKVSGKEFCGLHHKSI